MNAPVEEIRRFQGHQDDVVKVCFSPDGRRILSASRNGDIYLFDVDSGRQISRVLGGAALGTVAFSPDGKRALRSTDELQLIDLENGTPLAHYGRLGTIEAASFLPDGRTALYGHRDHSVRMIELEHGRELGRFDGQKSQPQCLACSGDGRFIIAGRFDAYDAPDVVLVWDLKAAATSPRRPERLMTMVSSLAVSPDNARVLTGTMDASVYLWDVATGREIRSCQGHSGNVLCVAFAPAGNFLVSGSGTDYYDAELIKDLGIDNTVRLWDAQTGRELARALGHERNVFSVAVSPDGKYVLSGSADRTIRLWAVPRW